MLSLQFLANIVRMSDRFIVKITQAETKNQYFEVKKKKKRTHEQQYLITHHSDF